MNRERLFTQLRGLHNLGFALIWLYPQSKRPIEMKWTSLERKSRAQLEKEHQDDYNVGVRLGRVSKIDGRGYLAVVDCDVKSTEARHESEMRARLNALFPTLGEHTPCVRSGRGNGSRHFYVVTKEVEKPRRLAQSSEHVRVKMPSTKASRHEIETLTKEEIDSGVRLRAAWEISFMGEGQQVVLPPSIHPDTGAEYAWSRTISSKDDLLEVSLVGKTKDSETRSVIEDFEFVDVDLVGSSLPSEIVDLILSGDDSADRSASLLKVAISLVKHKYTKEQILSILSDPQTYLGQAAYEHTKSDSRKRAAQWLWKYTVEKAMREFSAAHAFQSEVETTILSDEDAERQESELLKASGDWKDALERTQNEGKPKNSLQNVLLIIRNEFGFNAFLKNTFSYRRIHGVDFPWTKAGTEIKDEHMDLLINWISSRFRFEPSLDKIYRAIVVISEENSFHPVKDYLASLPVWDGVSRLDHWLKNYLRASGPDEYLQAISRKTLCAMIARIYRPGIKFDHVLVLEGLSQGEGKSRFVSAMGDPWSGSINLKMSHQDLVLQIRDKWVVELSELAGLASKKADLESIKAFISTETDRVRVPYGKLPEEFPRQCVFIGTTNDTDYLSDPSGNRRFWPVRVEKDCDVDGFKRDREQLFAEAKFAYELGEDLWLEKDVEAFARIQQLERLEDEPWIEKIQLFLVKAHDNVDFNSKRFTTRMLFQPFGPFADEKDTNQNTRRVAKCLKRLGYVLTPVREKDHVFKAWVKRNKNKNVTDVTST